MYNLQKSKTFPGKMCLMYEFGPKSSSAKKFI